MGKPSNTNNVDIREDLNYFTNGTPEVFRSALKNAFVTIDILCNYTDFILDDIFLLEHANIHLLSFLLQPYDWVFSKVESLKGRWERERGMMRTGLNARG